MVPKTLFTVSDHPMWLAKTVALLSPITEGGSLRGKNNTGRLMLLFEVSASQPQLPCETWFILAYTVLAASNSSEWCIAIPLTFFSFPYSHVNKISAPESSQSISCKLRRVDVWFVEFPCANYCCSLSCWSSRITR